MTQQEINYTRSALQELVDIPWATPLLTAVNREGLTLENRPLMFEARVAYELARQGVAPIYEYQAGVGRSSVDFYIPSNPGFLVEVVSLRMSEGSKGAVRQNGDFYTYSMSSENLRVKGQERQSLESEIIVAQRKIGHKVFAEGRVTKFPPVTDSLYHVILVDARGLARSVETVKDIYDDLKLIMRGYQ